MYVSQIQMAVGCFVHIPGVRWTISSLSEAPRKVTEYTNQGVQYLKDLTK